MFWFIELDPPALGIKSFQVLQLPIKRKQERVHLDPALASRLEPIQFKTGLSASTLTAKLDARDNKFTLKVELLKISLYKHEINLFGDLVSFMSCYLILNSVCVNSRNGFPFGGTKFNIRESKTNFVTFRFLVKKKGALFIVPLRECCQGIHGEVWTRPSCSICLASTVCWTCEWRTRLAAS